MSAVCSRECDIGHESTVSIGVARALIETAEHAGVQRERLLAGARFDPRVLELADTQLPRAEVYRLCEVALDLTGDEQLGLRWGDHVPDHALNLVSGLVMHAGTLRDAFDMLFRFARLLSHEPGIRLIERDDSVTVRCLRIEGASPRVQRFVAELTMTGILRLIRSFHINARPIRVSFDYPAPLQRDVYAQRFESTECFDQRFTGIVFAKSLLDSPSSHKDEALHGTLRSLAERRLWRLTQQAPYAVRVREVVVKQATPHRTPMSFVARELDLSVRSLQRRLAEEDQSFVDIVHEASALVARRLMLDEKRSIQEAAFEMGFADASSFHRAFKRWTGSTPGTLRD